nr:MAG TPA: hypothetical protein [Caudoviricetes sp.]
MDWYSLVNKGAGLQFLKKECDIIDTVERPR